MRLPSRVTSIPAHASSGIAGTLTLRSWTGSRPRSRIARATTVAAAAASVKSSGAKSSWLIANAGQPERTASIAALTVPEYVMSSPRFAPWLMPLATRSIGPGSRPRKTSPTASDGEPSIDHAGVPSASVRSRTRSGRHIVREWPTALWFVSGAITRTSPRVAIACASASRPRDSMPSSLVTRMRGRLPGAGGAGLTRATRLPWDPAPAGPGRGVPRAPPGGVPLGRERATQREHEDGTDDGGDRQAEDRAGDPGDLGADQDARDDDDRRNANRARHDPRLDQVHHHEPADPHPDERPHGRVPRDADERDQYRRHPRDERPKEGDRHEDAGRGGDDRDVRQPQRDAHDERHRRVEEPQDGLAAEEAAERPADRVLQEPRLGGVPRGHQAEDEGEDRLAVDDHEDRQEKEDQHVAHDADAGHGRRLERSDETLGGGRESVEERVRLRDEINLAEAERRQAVRPRLEDRRQLLAQARDVPDELQEGVEQRLCQEHEQRQEHHRQDRVDRDDRNHAREPWHRSQEEPDRRREDEGEQPRQEERQDLSL